MASVEERTEILNYIFTTVMGEDDLPDKLREEDLNTPRKIALIKGEEAWANFAIDKDISMSQLNSISIFLEWVKWHLKKNGHGPNDFKFLPSTLEEWKEAFNDEALGKQMDEEGGELEKEEDPTPDNEEKKETISVNSDESGNGYSSSSSSSSGSSYHSTRSKGSKKKKRKNKATKTIVKVSLQDFPEFDGKHHNWLSFRRTVTATMGLLGLQDLLTLKASDVPSHKAKRAKSRTYNKHCIDFYSILTKKLAKGSATSVVDGYFQSQDGPLTWLELTELYNFGGDKDSRMVTILDDLTNQHLRHDSRGGFVGYKNSFENKVNELICAEPDPIKRENMFPDILKKSMFLKGIEDRDYSTVKDSVDGLTYVQTVNKLYKKAVELGKADGRGERRQQYRRNNGGNNSNRNGNSNGGNRRRNNGGRDRRRQNNTSTRSNGGRGKGGGKNNGNNSSSNNGNNNRNHNSPGFSSKVWNMMGPAEKQWIEQARKQPPVQYGNQYSNDTDTRSNNNVNTQQQQGGNSQQSSDSNRRVTFQDQGSQNRNSQGPQSIFRRQSMLRTVTVDEDERNANPHTPLQAPRVTAAPATPITNKKAQQADPIHFKQKPIHSSIMPPRGPHQPSHSMKYRPLPPPTFPPALGDPLPIMIVPCPRGFHSEPRFWRVEYDSRCNRVFLDYAVYEQSRGRYEVSKIEAKVCKRFLRGPLYQYMLGVCKPRSSTLHPKIQKLIEYCDNMSWSGCPPYLNDDVTDHLPPIGYPWEPNCIRVRHDPPIPRGHTPRPSIEMMQRSHPGQPADQSIIQWKEYDPILCCWKYFRDTLGYLKTHKTVTLIDMLFDDPYDDPNDSFGADLMSWARTTNRGVWVDMVESPAPRTLRRLTTVPVHHTTSTLGGVDSDTSVSSAQESTTTSGSSSSSESSYPSSLPSLVRRHEVDSSDDEDSEPPLPGPRPIDLEEDWIYQQSMPIPMTAINNIDFGHDDDYNADDDDESYDQTSYASTPYDTEDEDHGHLGHHPATTVTSPLEMVTAFYLFQYKRYTQEEDESSVLSEELTDDDFDEAAFMTARVNHRTTASSVLTQSTVTRVLSKHLPESKEGCQYLYPDSGADTSSVGGDAWIVDQLSGRCVNVIGFDEFSGNVREKIEIGSAVTAVDLPSPIDETILVRINEATIMDDANTLLSTFQARESGTVIDDVAAQHGGGSYIATDEYVLPLKVRNGLLALPIRRPTDDELKSCYMIELTSSEPWHPEKMKDADVSPQDYGKMLEDYDSRKQMVKRSAPTKPNISKFMNLFYCPSEEVATKTIENTTAVGNVNTRFPMKQHYMTRNPLLQRRRFTEDAATDTRFATVTSYEGYNCAQVFVGIKTHCEHNYGMARESDGPEALLEYFRQEGVPTGLIRDNSKMQQSRTWQTYLRRYWVKDGFTEPYHPNQNPAEVNMRTSKAMLIKLFVLTGCDPRAWFKAMEHVADLRNHLARENLNWRTPIEARDGYTPDISGLLQYSFWQIVLYRTNKDDETFSNEGIGRWLGRAKNYGDGMCYWILDMETEELVVRSDIRSASDMRSNANFQELIERSIQEDSGRMNDGNVPLIMYDTGEEVTGSDGETETKAPLARVNPMDLIDLNIWEKYNTSKGNTREHKGTIVDKINDKQFRVEFDNGKQKIYDYEELVNALTKPDEEAAETWEFDEIIGHCWSKEPGRKGKVDVQVKWVGDYEPTWEPLEVIKKDDPVTLAHYALENELLEQSMWKWAKRYVKNAKKLERMTRQVRMNKKRTGKGIKYKFGVRIPRSIHEAYVLDQENGNNLWREAIQKEVKLLTEIYPSFKVPEDPSEITEDYQRIPILWVLDCKVDGRRRARAVGGGHRTNDIEFDLYSGVVNLEVVRMVFLIAILNDLQVIAGDISSAYLQSFTCEKIYTVLGEEFGHLAGLKVIVVRALYGLKLSAAMWHQKLADSLRGMGFVPSKADYDLWLRAREDHYEYIAVIVDDLLVFSKEPHLIIESLKEVSGYELKGVGVPEYYSGADVRYNSNEKSWEWMSRTYISNVCSKIEKCFDTQLRNYGSPLDPNDHPELDETDPLMGDMVQKYQMLVGSAQWAVTLGRFDVQYATNTLARYATNPKEGHLKRMLRVFGYLKAHNRARIKLDPSNPHLEDFKFVENEWSGLYDGAEETMNPDDPPPLNEKELQISIFEDASHASELDTRRSVSAYLAFLGKTPVAWYSKRQNTVETSTYSSELVAFRVAIDKGLAMRAILRALGMKVTKPMVIFCDSQSVCCNMQLPSSILKKKHQLVNFHRSREAVAMGIAKVAHVRSEFNLADIGTKPKGPQDYYRLLKEVLYGKQEDKSET